MFSREVEVGGPDRLTRPGTSSDKKHGKRRAIDRRGNRGKLMRLSSIFTCCRQTRPAAELAFWQAVWRDMWPRPLLEQAYHPRRFATYLKFHSGCLPCGRREPGSSHAMKSSSMATSHYDPVRSTSCRTHPKVRSVDLDLYGLSRLVT